ncbi:class E sortase [Acidiferrimicrobium sp. IK]|uniref:class E sortase n=1 Tax=Acidiferrimicrobium sp. IK TaxID=2871700 RepID=UPI0021CB785B|nr:class E sortase [Acidiferrimicrobium sp. IK]MCU4187429.1 class E sortase [Acidiferrimicrobium sp. IK]
MDRLLAYLAATPGARRALTVAAGILVATAVVLLGFPVYTDLVHNDLQGHLRSQFASQATKQAYETGKIRDGQSLTKIDIPKIGVNVVVVQGTDDAALRAGAGHYPSTPLPCTTGDVGIAGHRTTYGKPFANVDRLGPGDLITLTTPVGSCVYKVNESPFVVVADDWGVVSNTPGLATLTLTSCHPKGSAAYRIVIKATMVSSESFT